MPHPYNIKSIYFKDYCNITQMYHTCSYLYSTCFVTGMLFIPAVLLNKKMVRVISHYSTQAVYMPIKFIFISTVTLVKHTVYLPLVSVYCLKMYYISIIGKMEFNIINATVSRRH